MTVFRRAPLMAPCILGKPRVGVVLVLWCSLECTPACQAGGRGFKSRQDRGRIAQSVERAPEKREVVGSMPTPTTAECECRLAPTRVGTRLLL